MALPSSAVTFTLMTVSPTASATWRSVTPVSASVSVMSDPSRYSNVAPESVVIAVTVTSSTSFATIGV